MDETRADDGSEEPPIERLLRERAGLLTGLCLTPVAGLVFIAVFGRGEGAYMALCPASIFAAAALLPGSFLLGRLRKCRRSLVCGRCEKPVVTRGGMFPAWYDADAVDYRCDKCKVSLCGKCATSTATYSDSLQSLKARYGRAGAALKRAVDADPQAAYEKGELDPICPTCEDYLRKTGRVL